MKLAPIILFVYNRLHHTKRTVEALKSNKLASKSNLIIYSDGVVEGADDKEILEVRRYVRTVTGFKSLKIVERERNWGLANSIIGDVSENVNRDGRVIVLEDDLVTSPYFLSFMNEALELYAEDDRVVSIHGYVYPVEQELPEAFFLPGADCWGWATWRRGWACFNSDGQYLLDELKHRKLIRSFDFNGAYPYSEMLEGQIKGINDSWAVRWYASAFLAGKLTLYPGRSLVHNIGNDESGTHCSKSDKLDTSLTEVPIDLSTIPVKSSHQGRQAFEIFFLQQQTGWLKRLAGKLMKTVKELARDWLPPVLLR